MQKSMSKNCFILAKVVDFTKILLVILNGLLYNILCGIFIKIIYFIFLRLNFERRIKV